MTKDKNILKSDEGKFLTNGNTFGTIVYLAKNDSVDNWYEITVEEYETIIADNEEI